MSEKLIQKVDYETRQVEKFYARRLRRAAAVGTNPGCFSISHIYNQMTGQDTPCQCLFMLEIPLTSEIKNPIELLPIFSGFTLPFCLILSRLDETISFQVAAHEEDAGFVVSAFRSLYDNQIGIEKCGDDGWNEDFKANNDTFPCLFLPKNSLFPLSFMQEWDKSDIISSIIECFTNSSTRPALIQIYISPCLPPHLGTDIVTAVAHLGRLLESHRVKGIQERFSRPLYLFSIRTLSLEEGFVNELEKMFSSLKAPYNEIRRITLNKRKEEILRRAVIARTQGLADSLSLISSEELSGLWHFPLTPSYNLRRIKVRDVATEKIDALKKGRILGYHTERGKETPVILPYSARNQHLAVFGKSQSGKSTRILKLILNDVRANMGTAILDIHDLGIRLMPHIKKKDYDRVIIISPRLMNETGRYFCLNLFDLANYDPLSKEFITESLKDMLSRITSAEAVGPRTQYILEICSLALLADREEKHTVLDISKVIINKRYREELIAKIDDIELQEKLWGFNLLGQGAFSSPLNKIQYFFRDSIRSMIGAKENGFNKIRGSLSSLLDVNPAPIIIIDLSGVPRSSAILIGSTTLALLELESFKRDTNKNNKPFHIYVDEAPALTNLSNNDLFTSALNQTAKFQTFLTLVSQSYTGINEEVRKSLSVNAGALMFFALGQGSGDTKLGMRELHDEYDENQLNKLPQGHAAVRVGEDVFSVYSPDLPKPAEDHSRELIDFSLNKYGEKKPDEDKINESDEMPFKEENTVKKKPVDVQALNKKQPRRVELLKLEADVKKVEILSLLLYAGMVPLQELSDIFFNSPQYGRQALKKLAGENLVDSVKLSRKLFYYLTPAGQKKLKGAQGVPVFTPDKSRFLEHAILTGKVAARIFNQGKSRGAIFSIRREHWINENLRPDLVIRWRDKELDLSLTVEADRGTMSASQFIEEKVKHYISAISSGSLSYSGKGLVILTVTEDKTRADRLAEAVKREVSEDQQCRFFFADISDWTLKTDFLRSSIYRIPHTADLISIFNNFPFCAIGAEPDT